LFEKDDESRLTLMDLLVLSMDMQETFRGFSHMANEQDQVFFMP